MCKLSNLMTVLQEIAPLSLSQKMIEKGDYDNSGLIIESSDTADKILFSLDLSVEVVERAKELGCDTIITHHPAIYAPIKNLSVNDQTKALILAIQNRISVISMHLNLDIASAGIDHSLALGLGGRDIKILDLIDGEHGYGRVSTVDKQSLVQFVEKVERTFETRKLVYYGNREVNKIASFCGSGGSQALQCCDNDEVDTVITSDLAHHHLKELIENDKNVVILPHYVSEQYGFNKFYQAVSEKLNGKAQTFYFVDNRFM
ncbi:MAG: Nif3-like dinuclear metal center hexameric protein [Clostridiales bacterium]|nr:Nif3-like dinuclear metal center hexameric protein [Clostridiales bacterium]